MARTTVVPFPARAISLGVWAILLAPGMAAAADTETRDFTISIDGKRAGEYHMTISRQDDGTATMVGEADVRLSFFGGLKVYTYQYRGTEAWKDGRLQRLDGTSNDDGKAYAVSVVPDNDKLRLRVNGQERLIRPDVWVTTYWRLPVAAQRNGAVPLLDGDTGKEINATLKYVGPGQVNVGGQARNCAHYRLTGGVQVDVWYDDQERLVRQEWVEDGHKSILELTRVRR